MKQASILDYQQETLSKKIWRNSGQLRTGVRHFIYSSLEGFFDYSGISGYSKFVEHLYIGSSLATHFYTQDSDLDIKVIIDLEVFRRYNTDLDWLHDADLLDKLIDKGRESVWLTKAVPGTFHPLDIYFYSAEEFYPIELNKYDSLYDVTEDTWLKEPQKLMGGLSPVFVLNKAKELSKSYLDTISLDIARTKRDSIDFLILKDYIKQLPEVYAKRFYKELGDALELVNDDVERLLSNRDAIKLKRQKTFSKKDLQEELEQLMGSYNYSSDNIRFKMLQRYGYMKMLTELSRAFGKKKIDVTEIEDLIDIIE